MGVDIVTGLFASRYIGLPIKSKRLFNSITKLVFYLSALVLTNMTIKTYACLAGSEGLCWLTTVTLVWIYSIETKSINENFRNMGYKLPACIENVINNVFDVEKWDKVFNSKKKKK